MLFIDDSVAKSIVLRMSIDAGRALQYNAGNIGRDGLVTQMAYWKGERLSVSKRLGLRCTTFFLQDRDDLITQRWRPVTQRRQRAKLAARRDGALERGTVVGTQTPGDAKPALEVKLDEGNFTKVQATGKIMSLPAGKDFRFRSQGALEWVDGREAGIKALCFNRKMKGNEKNKLGYVLQANYGKNTPCFIDFTKGDWVIFIGS